MLITPSATSNKVDLNEISQPCRRSEVFGWYTPLTKLCFTTLILWMDNKWLLCVATPCPPSTELLKTDKVRSNIKRVIARKTWFSFDVAICWKATLLVVALPRDCHVSNKNVASSQWHGLVFVVRTTAQLRTLFYVYNIRLTASGLQQCSKLFIVTYNYDVFDHEGRVVGEAVRANRHYTASKSVGHS